MAVFHVTWDAHFFGLTAIDPNRDPAWHFLGQTVASTFLFLSGFGLILADRAGVSSRRSVGRLLHVAAAALLVTLASWILAPANVILVGILQCIVITNVIALALRRSPIPALICLGAISMALPLLLRGVVTGLAWTWLGLSATEPDTLDFRPVFPWLAPVLIGVAAARTTVPNKLSGWRPKIACALWLCKAGRHSLVIYLLHQPIAFALLFMAAHVTGISSPTQDSLSNPAQAVAFIEQCSKACIDRGKDAELCRSTCHCVLTALTHASPKREIQSAQRSGADRVEDLQPSSDACMTIEGATKPRTSEETAR